MDEIKKVYRTIIFLAGTNSGYENLTTIYDMPAYKIGYMLSGNSIPAVFLFPGCHTRRTASHTITFTMAFFPFGTTTVME